jgi:hypothetical protein
MVTVKKNTINREAFEREMDEIKNLVRQGTDPDVVILAINNAKSRLIEYEEKKDTDPFEIPKWMNTVTVKASDIGE